MESIVERYNADHPDRVIETLYKENEDLRNLFVTASVGGKGPELIYGPADNVGLLALTETIMPLDTVFSESFYDQFTDEGRVTWDGSTWMVADQIGNHLVLVYNKDLLPEPPESFDDFIEIGKELTVDEDGDGRMDRYALAWNYTEPFFFVPFLTGFGGWVMDDEGRPTLDTEATVKAIQFILDLRDKHQIIPREADYDIAETLFKEGRAAAIINGPWSWASYGEAGINYGLTRIPKIPETGLWCTPMISAKGYSINVNVEAEKLPIVKEVITFLTGFDVQVAMSEHLATVPVNRRALEDPRVTENPTVAASMYQSEISRPMPLAPQLRQVWDGTRGPYQLVMSGKVSAEEGARRMQAQVEKLIRDTFL
jgi:maltose-binding protein MalE